MKLPPRILDWFVWAAIGGAAFVMLRHRDSGPAEGSAAPSINLPLVGKSEHFVLDKARGKPVVLEVFASWCGTCRRAAPVLADAYRAHSPSDVTFLAVSVDDSLADAERAKQRWQIPYDVALDDGSVQRGYRVSLLPTVVVIGRDGTVRHSTTGVPSSQELDAWIAER